MFKKIYLKMSKEYKPKSISRRKFIGSALVSALSFSIVPRSVLGGTGFVAPSDKIVLGYIGLGKLTTNTLLPRFIENEGTRVVAGADVDAKKMKRFVASVNQHYSTNNSDYSGCEGYLDFREVIARKDIDAVIVATPDHWHAIPTIQAARSGKDVYCEKPLSHTIAEGKSMVKAVRDNWRVLQTGSMQRSWRDFRHAAELVRNGYLGEIKHVKVAVGDPPKNYDLAGQDVPDYLSWNTWVGPSEFNPYNEVLSPPIEQDHWPRWRDYKEYGGGGMADWGAHMFDIAQWGLGMDRSGPVEVTPSNGNDVKHLTYRYANGITMTHEDFGKGWAVRFEGTDGNLEVSRSFLNTEPANLKDIKIKPSEHLYVSNNHYQNFLDSIKERKDPIADVETGHRTATVCYMGNIAYELGRKLQWDPERESFVNDEEANSMMFGPRRGIWNNFI